MLEQADRDRIAEAVGRAEASTSGEIVCVLARRTSDYLETPVAFGTAAALVLPALAVGAGWDPEQLTRVFGGWTAAHMESWRVVLSAALGAYAVIQAVTFAVVAAVVALPSLRVRLTPSLLTNARVREAAHGQLAAASLAAGPARAAVVIFAAEAERRVEILASESAHAAIGQAAWDEAIQALQGALRRGEATEGFIEAVRVCGEALSRAFPETRPDANAVPDRPLEL